jgi:hypothetical protein
MVEEHKKEQIIIESNQSRPTTNYANLEISLATISAPPLLTFLFFYSGGQTNGLVLNRAYHIFKL